MTKQTAVEWLRCQLDELEMTKNKRSLVLQYDLISEAFNQALEMERQQIIDSHISGYKYNGGKPIIKAEQYYTQTFTELK